ncbi:phosphoadenosine phosphosulfate reductase family protein [Marinitoga sp. 1138]|uniref:phosphoadenosine phosphosulfate reductase family protein n=1 Tax=Marinitoga sp. 1138 TaxID=1643334 RepID=UPI00158683C1|nr:phosphoadenosine phosphosulfate reductase family protein [Marinitoga sp. 1138]NUU96748.1 hypothetical protein [Marinitoga sp. 1138]
MKNTFKAWAKTESFQKKVAEAKLIIHDALKKSKKMYIAFSGGKDSTCLLHLVLKFNPNILVWHWDYGIYIPRKFEYETIENAKKIGARNIRIDTSNAYRYKEKVFYNTFFGKILPEFEKQGYDGVFVGLRKQESISRRERIKAKRIVGNIQEYWPLQNWDWKDVWAYIFSNDLPYHSAYNIYAPVIGWDKVRFATFFDPEFDFLGNSNLDGMLLWRWKNAIK